MLFVPTLSPQKIGCLWILRTSVFSQELTVSELLEEGNTFDSAGFGIPHFQRGAVWKEHNQGLLLESLHFNTPVGTLFYGKWNTPMTLMTMGRI